MRLYFSRSFSKTDQPIYQAVRHVLEDPSLATRLHLELFDSVRPRGKQVAVKITSDIALADVVICIFARRHRIQGKSAYSAPSFVSSEAAYALAMGKKLVLFLEDGVDSNEMGLVGALGLEYVRFDRRHLGTVEFVEAATSTLEAVLREGMVEGVPAHAFRRYEMHHTVYPNGYGLSHFKISVEVFRNDPVEHSFLVFPSGPSDSEAGLPSAAELLESAKGRPCPYPEVPFVAFASATSDIRFEPSAKPARPRERIYEVLFPRAGRRFDYEWMYGSHGVFGPERPYEYTRVLTSVRAVDRVDLLLRIHREINRTSQPRLIFLPAETTISVLKPDQFRILLKEGGHGATLEEHTPLYRCYHFAVAPTPRGTDIAVVY